VPDEVILAEGDKGKGETMTATNYNLDAARSLVAAGFHLLPCDPETKKVLVPSFGYATNLERGINYYFGQRFPHAMPAILHGKSGTCALDVDMGHGDDGIATLESFLNQHGEISPLVPIVRTPRGGLHLYFMQTTGEPFIGQRVGIAPGLDTRGGNGYTIAPGAVNADGVIYDPIRGDLAEAKRNGTLTLPPAWLIELASRAPVTNEYIRSDRPEREGDPSSGEPGDDDPERSRAWAIGALRRISNRLARTREGARNAALNNAVATLAGLAWCGLSEIEIRDAMLWASEINGYIASDGLAAFEATWRSAWTFGISRPLQGPRDREPDPVIAGFVEKLESKREQGIGEYHG
jgi:Bifunctional DNA primase/polymerase, N-terminal